MPKNFLSDTAVAQILGEHGISGDDFETVLIYANVEGAWGLTGGFSGHSNTEAIFYCTAGIRSGFGYFTLRLLGYEHIRNYDGSWFERAADSTLPLE